MTHSLGQARLDEILDGAGPTEGDARVMGQCISQETLARTIMGFLVNQVSDLSDDTLRCVWSTLAEADLKGLLSVGDMESQLMASQALLNASLCLTDEEVARAETGAGTMGIPLAAIRCLAGRVDAESLKALFSAEQGSLPVGVMAAMLECGMPLVGEGVATVVPSGN